MPSLMRQLLDTLPFAALRDVVQAEGTTTLEKAPVSLVRYHLLYLQADDLAGLSVGCAKPTSLPPAGNAETPIWSYEVGPALGEFSNLWCRVRDEGFRAYKVLERARIGIEEGGKFEPAIQVRTPIPVKLPLTERFRALSFMVTDARNVAGAHPLWPLAAVHEPSVLHVLVYDLAVDGSLHALADGDHPERAALEELRSRCTDWLRDAGAPESPNDPSLDGPTFEDELLRDELWPTGFSIPNPLDVLRAPQTLALTLRPIRIVVAVWLVLCREDPDFAFGSGAGVGRVYPQAMVKSTHPLAAVECTIQLDRPSATQTEDGRPCSCNEMGAGMRSILLTDSNNENLIYGMPAGVPMPLWNNLFSYCLPDPFRERGDLRYHVVRSDRPRRRVDDRLIQRTAPHLPGVSLIPEQARDHTVDTAKANLLAKEPRQGAFDNLHLAPRMVYLGEPQAVRWVDAADPLHSSFRLWDASMRARLRLEDIAMAPICAHDCFHLHWRWGSGFSDRFTWGFDGQLPYKRDGAAMVPSNQDVWVRMRSDFEVSYHAASVFIGADTWVPFFHHGAAYAVSTSMKVTLGRASPDGLDGMAIRFGPDVTSGSPVEADATNSWAIFYWRLRYNAYPITGPDGNPDLAVEERCQVLDWAKVLDF